MAIRKYILEKQDEIPALDRYQILTAIKQMETPRNKALIAFLYLTGARIEEVVKFKKQGEWKGRPIEKRQIEERSDTIYIRGVRTLKRGKRIPRRTIPIIKNHLEQPFIDLIKEYLQMVDHDQPLFNISRQWAEELLARVGLFPHWLRHSRSTHLVTDYDFNDAQLCTFHGWSSRNTARHYTHLNVGDLVSKMSNAQI